MILNEALYAEPPLGHTPSVLILTWQGLLDGLGIDGGGLEEAGGLGVASSIGDVGDIGEVGEIGGDGSPPMVHDSKPIVRR